MTGTFLIVGILVQVALMVGIGFFMVRLVKRGSQDQLQHLHKQHTEMTQKQAELKAKIQSAEQEYQSKMVQLEQEIHEKQMAVQKEASQLLEKEKQTALQERDKIINEAVETREKMRQEIMAQMEDRAIEYSRDIIGEFFSGELSQMLHNLLMDQLIEGLTSADLEHFQIDTHTASLKAAYPISEDKKRKILSLLKEKIKRDVQFQEETNSKLIGGAILEFGSFVIDGSMVNRLKEKAALLRKETQRRYQSTT